MPTAIRFKGIVGTTTQLESDKFAGRIGWNTTLARYVVYYDATNYATMARRDVLETFSAGIQDSTLTSGRVMLAGTSGRLQGDAGFTFSQVSGVTRRIIVGDGLVASNIAAILRRTATFRAAYETQDEAGFTRWGMRLDSASTDWLLTAQNAAGSDIDNPIRVVNASAGQITIGGSTARPIQATGVLAVNATPRPTSEYIYTTYSSTTMQGVNVEYLAASVGQPLVTANATGNADATQILFRGRSLATNRFLVYANGDLDITGAYKTGTTTRISSGGAGTLTTLSTTGLATLAQAAVSDIASGSVVLAGTSGRLQGSPLFTYITSPSVSFVVGDGVTASQSAISVDAPSASDALLSLRAANFSRWTLGRVATTLDFALAARNSSGVVIDNPINIVNASAGLITIGGSTARPVSFTGALSTTGLATLAQATVSDLTTGRMVSTTTAGRLQTLDAAGSRSLIGAYGSGDNASFGTLTTTGRYYVGSGGSAGQPRIGSGQLLGTLVLVHGQDIDDAGGAGYVQLQQDTVLLGSTKTGALAQVQATNVTLSGSAISVVAAATFTKTTSSTIESISGNIFNQYTAVTQTGIVTNQSLAGTGAGSRTIGAGRLNTQGAGINVYLCGTYTTDAAPGNATIRVRLGSTTFRTMGSFALDANITNGIWWIRGRITTRTTGATGTIGGQLMWEHQASNVVGSQVLHIEPSTSTADVTLDLTASQTFDVDWTATDAGTSITCTCFALELVR